MAFGQPSGPPASARQMDELAAKLAENGYNSFREARHPFGLTQRQANGRFSIEEAESLLERLEAMETVSGTSPLSSGVGGAVAGGDLSGRSEGDGAPIGSTHATGGAVPTSDAARSRSEMRRRERDAKAVSLMDAEVLADELAERGWCCIPPE